MLRATIATFIATAMPTASVATLGPLSTFAAGLTVMTAREKPHVINQLSNFGTLCLSRIGRIIHASPFQRKENEQYELPILRSFWEKSEGFFHLEVVAEGVRLTSWRKSTKRKKRLSCLGLALILTAINA
jgi:hypothetical protein